MKHLRSTTHPNGKVQLVDGMEKVMAYTPCTYGALGGQAEFNFDFDVLRTEDESQGDTNSTSLQPSKRLGDAGFNGIEEKHDEKA